MGKAIPLKEAPARFLDVDFARLVRLTGSDAKALEALSHPDPGILVYCRRQAIAAGVGHSRSQVDEDIYTLVEKTIADFKTLGASSQIAGYGIYSGTGLRQMMPPELWAGLTFDFNAGAAGPTRGFGCSYNFIEIEETRSESGAGELLASLVAWLRRRQSKAGDEPKKLLQEAAKKEFANAFRVRIFNDAYKEVYGRSRGRPAHS